MTEQTTIEKAADIAEWYLKDKSLHTKNPNSGRTRFHGICETWGVSEKSLNDGMARRAELKP